MGFESTWIRYLIEIKLNFTKLEVLFIYLFIYLFILITHNALTI